MGNISQEFIEIMQEKGIGEVVNGVWYAEGQSVFFDMLYNWKCIRMNKFNKGKTYI